MPYQFVREPLRAEEADQLCQACGTMLEKLIVWILIDTGLRVSELCALTSENIMWQQRSLRISGKGGPYGKKSKKRVVPMSNRVRALLEHYYALNETFPVGARQVQKIVKGIANKAKITTHVRGLGSNGTANALKDYPAFLKASIHPALLHLA